MSRRHRRMKQFGVETPPPQAEMEGSAVSNTSHPEQWFVDLFAGVMTSTGLRVSVNDAMSVPSLAACVNILAEDIAKVPLKLYKKQSKGSKVADTDHPLYHLLHDFPSPWMTSFTWRRVDFGSALTRGNGVTRIFRSGRGEVRRLMPLRPDQTTLRWTPEGEPFFDVSPSGAAKYTLSHEDVIHNMYRPDIMVGRDGGVSGVSPISRHTEAIALAIATERFASMFFKNGARPSVAIEMPGRFPNNDVANRIRRRLEDAYSGLSNSFKVAVLELGMKLKEISYKNSDSQLIEVRKEQAVEMCRIFGVPPHKIGILDKATFSNIEHQAIEYVTGPISALATSQEAAIRLSALTRREQEHYFVAFDLNGLLRGDIASRYRAYAIGRQWGWLSADDVREWEDMGPLPNEAGKSYYVPVNMQEVGNEDANDDGSEKDAPEVDPAATPSKILGPDGLPIRSIAR